LSIKGAAHDRSEPPEVTHDSMAVRARLTTPGLPMKPKPKEEALTADDLECLWAIARRATIQDRLVAARGRELEKRGLIELSHQWPTLTAKGRRILKEYSAQAILDLHREPKQR
jgi:hypothetical protein